MSQNDYIILRDENGTPYIAHAGLLDNARNAIRGAANSISTTAQQVANKAKGVGRGVRQNHKYILKVFENGKARYFYKQEEVKAYYEAKKRGIKNAAEYAQNAVKDKASNIADAAKNVVNKVTGVTANKTAETAKKNADDAHRWAKMTERVHKENLANFKQNPTEANLAKAKQSGQAVTRANQNEKNARKEANKAQDIADQHPVNKAKSAFDQAKKSADNTVANAKNNYERMKSEFKNKAQKTAQAAVDATINKAAYEAPRAAAKVKEAASDLMNTAKRKTGITAKEDAEKAERALIQAKRDSAKTEQVRREVTKNGEPDSNGNKWYKTEQEARRAGDAELAAERARNEVINKENSLKYARSRYEDTPLGKAQDIIDKARTAIKDKSEDLSTKAKSTTQAVKDTAQGMIDNARSSTAKAINEAWDKIPKNADGTVNPFDPKFQSTYNNWKNRKDKYDNSLTGQAKAAAEKATDSVMEMIDQAKKSKKNRDGSAEQGYNDVIDFINIAGQYRREAEARGLGYITNTIAGHTQSYSVLPPRDSQWRKDQDHAKDLATKINRTVNDYINGNLSLDDAKQKVENYKAELDSIDFEQYNDRKVRTSSKADATGRARARQFGSDTVSVPNANTSKPIKDKSEDLSAKAKSTVQSARDSVKGMIDNARSSTAKAVNEAWDRIPKNSDGTVNPFDKNFQSTYNDWKTKKDKYDSSLAGRAKDVAEKATNSVKDMIDQAKAAAKSTANKVNNEEQRIPEKRIEEQRIPEKRIEEQRIPERRITEQRIEESRIPERIESTKQIAEEQRSNDKRAAQRLSTSAELKGGEYVSLIDKYKQRYGEDYQNYLSKDEASKLQKARDNYQTAVEDANRAWDEFEKKWSKNK